MNRLTISLLGPMRVTLDGKPAQFEADTARALLAYLAVNTEAPHRRETLAGLLWSEQPERVALRNLRQALRRLRSAIGDRDADADPPFLLVTRKTVQFNRDSDYWLDVAAFTDSISASQEHRHRRLEVCRSCMRRLGEAVEVYRGEFLAGFSLPCLSFDEWLVVQRERLHRQVLVALGHLAAYHARRGEWEQAGGYARRQIELEPWQESAHRALMRALALSGERTAALAQYRACRRTLAEELGVEPEEETRALYERIRDGVELEALSPIPPHNLPVQPTPFVGREALLAEIEERLLDPDCRLLTLVGPGGSGKTRLALEVAAAQRYAFDHGVFFVNLAPLGSAEAIVPTVANALGFSFYTDAGGSVAGEPHRQLSVKQQLLDYVRQKNLLLIMDNYEHLLSPPFLPPLRGGQAGGELVTDILRTAPDVSILATSRARLNVLGEQLFSVGGMDVPDAETIEDASRYSAVQLFLTGARQIQPGFEATDDVLQDVVSICRLVEGMPLGIELATAWVEMLTPAEIAAEISQSLDFLKTDLRDVPARQRSMRAVFDHSWRLLSDREQEVFQRVSIFHGGFTREAAQEVTGASLRELKALVSKSLLHRTSTGRYGMHELLRQYAAERLDGSLVASEAARDRHGAYYTSALQAWGEDQKGPRQQAALAEMDVEIENARAAWGWAVQQGQVEQLDQAIDGLCRFYRWRGRYQEGEAACRIAAEKLAAVSGDWLRVLVRILTWQSVFSQISGRIKLASQLVNRSLALLEDPRLADTDTQLEKALVLKRLGDLTLQPDGEEARRLCEKSLALYQALGDRRGVADVLENLAYAVVHLGEYGEAKQLLEESLANRQAFGDQRGIADSLRGLSTIALYSGQIEETERLTQESLAIYHEMGERAGFAGGLGRLSTVLLFLGKFAEAQATRGQSVAIFDELGMRYHLEDSNVDLGFIKMYLGEYDQARVQGQMALALSRESGHQWGICASLALLGCVALAVEAYGEAQRLLQESVSIHQDIGKGTQATVLAELGYASRGLGQLPQARQYLYEALQTAAELGAFIPLVLVLPAIALNLADQGENERAVELYALVSRFPLVANSRWFEDVAGKHIVAIAASLPPDVVAAARERGRARDLWATAEELLVELGEKHEPDRQG